MEIDGRYVDEWDCDYYTFYSDGTGYYTYYDRYGYAYDEDFYWEERTGGRLYITYYDPSCCACDICISAKWAAF